MTGSNATVSSKKGMSTLERPRFGPGMLLQHGDLEQLTTYTRDLSRLLFRSIFGCGVICGLKVTPLENCGKVCISVEPGLALTCEGDPIYVPKKQTFAVDENCELEETELWVVLCGGSKCCAPRTSACPTDEDESSSVCTRERDWFELRVVREKPKCVCECEPRDYERDIEGTCLCLKHPVPDCYKDHYEGKCGCDCEDCEGPCGDCILLAKLTADDGEWSVDHSVRRFVRPILMRDPLSRVLENEATVSSTTSSLTADTGGSGGTAAKLKASSKKSIKNGG